MFYRKSIILLLISGIFLCTGCSDQAEDQKKNQQASRKRPSYNRNTSPLLEESIDDKYMGFETLKVFDIKDLKTDDEIKNIPVDENGNFYILDSNVNGIRKYSPDGNLIKTYNTGFSDISSFVYKNNNFYVLDRKKQIIFRTDNDFNIKARVLEGKPVVERQGNYNIAVDKIGRIYILNFDDGIMEIFSSDFKKLKEISTNLSSQLKIAYNYSENRIFIGDILKGKIHCFDIKNGKELYSFGEAGNQQGQIGTDFDIAYTSGKIYVSDKFNNRVNIYKSDNGKFISSFGVEGAGEGQFIKPVDIYAEPNGMIFVLEYSGHRVQVFDAEGKFIRSISEYGNKRGQLNNPDMIFGVPETGFIFVLDRERTRVQCFNYSGDVINEYSVLSQEFTDAFGIIGDNSGNMFIISPEGQRLIAYNPESMVKNIPDKSVLSSNLTIDDNGSIIFVNRNKLKLQYNEKNGRQLFLNYRITKDKSPDIEIQYDDFTVDKDNNVYILDKYNHRIIKYSPDGKILARFGVNADNDNDFRLDFGFRDGEFKNPFYIDVDFNNNLYVADVGNYRIQKFNSDGNFVKKFGKNGLGAGTFIGKFSFAINNNGIIAVTDYARSVMQMYDITGNFISFAGKFGEDENSFINPLAVGVDNNNDFYVLNSKSSDVFNKTDNLILKKLHIVDLFSKGLDLYKKGMFDKASDCFAGIVKYRTDEKSLFYGMYSALRTGDLEKQEYFDKILKKQIYIDENIKDLLKKQGYEL